MKKVNLNKTYEKVYKMNYQGRSYRTTLPPEVIKKKAKEVGLTVEKFIEKYNVKIHFNELDAGDMIIEFVKAETKK